VGSDDRDGVDGAYGDDDTDADEESAMLSGLGVRGDGVVVVAGADVAVPVAVPVAVRVVAPLEGTTDADG
jgi:hypothetical protein